MARYGYLFAFLLLWIVVFHVENAESQKVGKKTINLLKKEIRKTNKKVKNLQSQNQKQKSTYIVQYIKSKVGYEILLY